MLDVRRLRLLRDLARLGTIAAVAQAHAYTPSAVSQQLAALEREAGVPLLERTGRRRHPHAGRHRARPARRDGARRAGSAPTATLAAARTGLSGPLRIGAFPTAVPHAAAGRAGRAGPRPPGARPDGHRAGPGRRAGRAARRPARRGAAARLRHRAGRARPRRGRGAAAGRDGVPRRARRRPAGDATRRAARGRGLDRRQPRHAVPHRGDCGSARRPVSRRGCATTPTTSPPCSPWSPPVRASRWCPNSARRARRPGSGWSRCDSAAAPASPTGGAPAATRRSPRASPRWSPRPGPTWHLPLEREAEDRSRERSVPAAGSAGFTA